MNHLETAFLGSITLKLLHDLPVAQAGWLIHALAIWIVDGVEPEIGKVPSKYLGSWLAVREESINIHNARKARSDTRRNAALARWNANECKPMQDDSDECNAMQTDASRAPAKTKTKTKIYTDVSADADTSVRACDLRAFFSAVALPAAPSAPSPEHRAWLAECEATRASLAGADATAPVSDLMALLEGLDPEARLAVDIGNNSHWLSIATVELGLANRQLHSHSFGALGSALGRAIGAALAGAPHVVCTVGDQGLQMNSQELQLVRDLDLPITVVILNNATSGMIRDREVDRPGFLLTTADSGYGTPDFAALAAAYGLPYARAANLATSARPALDRLRAPLVVELPVDATIEARPNLPAGAPLECQVPPVPIRPAAPGAPRASGASTPKGA